MRRLTIGNLAWFDFFPFILGLGDSLSISDRFSYRKSSSPREGKGKGEDQDREGYKKDNSKTRAKVPSLSFPSLIPRRTTKMSTVAQVQAYKKSLIAAIAAERTEVSEGILQDGRANSTHDRPFSILDAGGYRRVGGLAM